MAKKKQKNKQKQKQKQRKVTQRQQKQAQRKQAQKQKRQHTAHQRQAERERIISARQQEIQARQQEKQSKGLKPKKKREKSENRKQLENRFKELADKANDILDQFDDENRMYVFDDDYGALFNDDTIMTNKGKFRKNPSKLTNEELEERTQILETFIEDAPEYEKDAVVFENFAEEFFYGFNSKEDFDDYKEDLYDKDKNKDNYDALWDFMNWVKAVCGSSLSSPEWQQIRDAVKSRFARGDSWSEIRKSFINAWNTYDNWDSFIDDFSEQGVLL